jgi:putative membrane protein
MKTNYLSTASKGLVVGASMLIPGVSGGTTAIILGIYDKLIHAVSSFFKNIKENLVFILIFCLGAGIGILFFSRIMLYAVETWHLPMMFLFLGAILGSIPMLYRQAKVVKFSPLYILFTLIGIAIVLSLGYLPKPESEFAGQGIVHLVMLFVTGMIIAVALVLPGISTSHMLLILGMYNTTLEAIKGLNISWLLPIALGGLAGIILTTRLIEKALTKFPAISYFFIIGFVLGSIIDVFPGFPSGSLIPVCFATFAAGYATIRVVSKYSAE